MPSPLQKKPAPKKKGKILDQLVDALTNRDEKAAAEKAAADAKSQEALKAAAKAKREGAEKAEQIKADARAKAEAAAKAKAAQEAAAAKAKAAALIAQQNKAKAAAQAAKVAAQAAAIAAAKPAALIKEHTIQPGETLSHLALHFYGHATPKYWKVIVDANKAEFGEEPMNYKPGSVIKIPVLPEELKAKK